MTQSEFNTAVAAWKANAETAEASYGSIATWNVAQVTNMYSAFRGSYNPAITTWDVSSVTDMQLMFHTNTAFNRGARPA